MAELITVWNIHSQDHLHGDKYPTFAVLRYQADTKEAALDWLNQLKITPVGAGFVLMRGTTPVGKACKTREEAEEYLKTFTITDPNGSTL